MLAYGISRLRISERIFDTLPKGSRFSTFQKLISEARLDNQVLFALDLPDHTDTDAALDTVAAFAARLEQQSAGLLTNITEFRENADAGVMAYALDHLPEIIDTSAYKNIDQAITPEAIRASIRRARGQLATPEGAWTKEVLVNDPLGLSFPFFQSLRESAGDSGFENGMVLINDGKQVLVTAQTAFPTGDSQNATALFKRLEALKTDWNLQHPEQKLHYFGAFAIAAQNAIQIKEDSIKTLAVALVLIMSLLWLYYRSLKTSFVILTPAAFGGLFALGVLGYLNPDVSGISLATGAVLLGIALDYSIHFVSHFKHTGSASRTVTEISTPLITGSLTTILAYSALIFANSKLLRDFGIFAGLALSSALIFTLTALPVILKLTGAAGGSAAERKPLFVVPEIPKRYGLPVLVFLGVLSIFFYSRADDVRFDGDPRNISTQSKALQEAERLMTPIDPAHDVQLYVFTSDRDDDRAADANTRVYQSLLGLKSNHLVKSFVSAAAFSTSDNTRNARQRAWTQYWTEKSAPVIAEIRKAGDDAGFSPGAFSGFEALISGQPGPRNGRAAAAEIMQQMGLDRLVARRNNESTYITTVVVDKKRLNEVKAAIGNIEGAEVFYRSEMAESLLGVVREDFNYILFVSAAIVFIALFLLYGRLELVLLSFLPMCISWIWILGITVLFDIKFNFVNVVFATFIFGLGDDFSIFMTDGLLQRYRQGRSKLSSYTSAISLSGLTVLIGTGALFFASHPALRSIAVVSVPGILCIVFISLVFQPVVFGLFVQNRVDKGRTPIGLATFVKTWACFLFFVCMCYLAFLVMLVLMILPFSKKRKQVWLAWVMHKLSGAVMYSGTQIRKKTFGREHLDPRRPVILIANHSSFLDTMIVLMHHPKAVIMVKEWVYKSPLYGWVIRYANYIFMEEGPEANADQARRLTDEGYSIIIFPEGTRSEDGKLKRFHKGAFFLAEQLHLPIQPFLIHGAGYVSPKNELVIKKGPVNVKILPAISPDDESWGENFQQRTKSISRYFKTEFEHFQHQMDDTWFLKQRVFNNYIFKGPVLEWYFKVKWELEKKNYERYDLKIGTRQRILDLGCGYGFLSFYLHFRNPGRQITGVDYDADKIEIAANAYDKTPRLSFVRADVRNFEIGPQDVIFLNDVLHYLSGEDQRALLDKCIENLSPGGILFIRDGITDETDRHQKTRLTEWLSTRLFSFNKTDGRLHFFSRQDIRLFAESHHLESEEEVHSRKTSNKLFILTKPGNQAILPQ
ncbi:MMPL family transporter [Ravibacter arvi]|uniref:MMPL family transporter n=2 Tax=Ravibacter arvi TaxID=2051041 RepID=A0ABP8M813_9BACT